MVHAYNENGFWKGKKASQSSIRALDCSTSYIKNLLS